MEISREARARQALGRRSAPAAVSSAAALSPGPSDTVESRRAAADGAARSERSERAARADRAEDRSREREREPESALGTGPVLAVRVGVPPIGENGNAQKTPSAAEAALRERAVLRDVGAVVSLPADEERRLLELTGQKSLGESDLREVSAVFGGSGSGAVRDPNEAARQIPLPGDGSRAGASAGQVQRATTQFSVIEAQATDELVTRFLGSSPPEDPGPEPRFREPLE